MHGHEHDNGKWVKAMQVPQKHMDSEQFLQRDENLCNQLKNTRTQSKSDGQLQQIVINELLD